jgi:hypothetical protein
MMVMTNIRIEYHVRRRTYTVIADTERFGTQQILFEGLKKKECIYYIEREGNVYTEVIEHADEKIDAALKRINAAVPYLIIKTNFVYESLSWARAAGMYFRSKILLDTRRYTVDTVIHEIGHYIHDVYLNDKQFRFPTTCKTNYAYKNYLENFAECFTQFVNGVDCDRTKKMKDILETLA